jgi:hypothetical protein
VLNWGKLGAAFRANPAALVGVEPLLQELETVAEEIRELGIQQDAQTAAVQQTSKEIKARENRGSLVATRLRNAAKAFYGTRTEKVIEFGIRPFRKLVRPPKFILVQPEPQKTTQEPTTEAPKPAS